jgi:lycopene elongase/hydratase (dihydrobisanhydrobacterioruberin-forming)
VVSDAPAAPGRGRAAGYRLLGRRLDYLLHLRPAEWPIMAVHTALGYVLAVGLAGAANGRHLGAALLGLALWVVCLNGGTLAINSAFDRDEGDVAYLRRPPPPPRRLFGFGLGLMTIGQAGALLLPRGYVIAYALCFLLSVLYSVPPARLKAVAGADWVVNMWGFGTLTPYAGWATTGLPLDTSHGLVLLAFCPLFAALYPLTQIYQLEEDRARGDRTLAAVLGVRRSLVAALAACVLAFGLFALAGLRSEWGTAGPGRWLALATAAAAWAAVLLPWLARYSRMSAADHQRGMHWALGAWAVTDLAVLAAWGR